MHNNSNNAKFDNCICMINGVEIKKISQLNIEANIIETQNFNIDSIINNTFSTFQIKDCFQARCDKMTQYGVKLKVFKNGNPFKAIKTLTSEQTLELDKIQKNMFLLAEQFHYRYKENIDKALMFILTTLEDTNNIIHCIQNLSSDNEYHYLKYENEYGYLKRKTGKLGEFYINKKDLSIHDMKIGGKPVK